MTAEPPLVERLWPDPAELPIDDAFADLLLPPAPAGRPLVAINMVTSIDGHAQLGGNAEGLSSRVDRRLMRLYRAGFDAVASGVGTLRADDFYSRLPADLAERRATAGRPPQPTAVLVAGESRIPTDRRWFGYADQPRVVAVASSSPHAGDEPLPGVETWVAPNGAPQPGWLLERLAAMGIGSVLLEGGPTVNAAFLAADAIDEVYWSIGPLIAANHGLPMIAPLPGSDERPRPARLVSAHRCGDQLFLRYRLGGIGP
jgi:5-amino-6-(5-phosphoribosylamino)uracil reductase